MQGKISLEKRCLQLFFRDRSQTLVGKPDAKRGLKNFILTRGVEKLKIFK